MPCPVAVWSFPAGLLLAVWSAPPAGSVWFALRQFRILRVQFFLGVAELLIDEVVRAGCLLLQRPRILVHKHRRDFGADLLRCHWLVENHAHVKARHALIQRSWHRLQR